MKAAAFMHSALFLNNLSGQIVYNLAEIVSAQLSIVSAMFSKSLALNSKNFSPKISPARCGQVVYNLTTPRCSGDSLRNIVHLFGRRMDMSRISVGSGKQDMEAQLKDLANEIISDLSALDPACGKELLSGFVSELFLAQAKQSQRAERRRRQAQGIAEAKARGVRFGRPGAALPENFEEFHRAWRSGEMTAQEAADACGVTRSVFYYAAASREQAEDRAV